jgi:hypothetical protein
MAETVELSPDREMTHFFSHVVPYSAAGSINGVVCETECSMVGRDVIIKWPATDRLHATFIIVASGTARTVLSDVAQDSK